MNYRLIVLLFLSGTLITISETHLQAEKGESNMENMSFIGIDMAIAKKHTELLNQLLANEYTLYTRTLNFHWNIKGKFFGPLHHLFQTQYEQLLGIVDTVAEQVKILGFHTRSTLQEFINSKTITEEPTNVETDTKMLEILMLGHKEVIMQIRSMLDEISPTNNYSLANILQDILGKHEKTHWMLKSHLE